MLDEEVSQEEQQLRDQEILEALSLAREDNENELEDLVVSGEEDLEFELPEILEVDEEVLAHIDYGFDPNEEFFVNLVYGAKGLDYESLHYGTRAQQSAEYDAQFDDGQESSSFMRDETDGLDIEEATALFEKVQYAAVSNMSTISSEERRKMSNWMAFNAHIVGYMEETRGVTRDYNVSA